MTRKLYWEDMYLREFDAQVMRADGVLIELDQTVFYPFAGGVANDTGNISQLNAQFRVTSVKSDGETIIHEVDRPGLVTGQSTHGAIDWDRRYKLMRMHTSAHLLSTIFHKESGALITGNQIDVERSRIDFSLENFDREKTLAYCELANGAIRKGAEVKTYFMPREEALKIPDMVKLATAFPPSVDQLRVVEIVGVDRQADGGNHVHDLKEIGRIELLKMENKGKTNRRVYYTVQ